MMNCEFKLFATSTEQPKERKQFWLCTIWDKADFFFFLIPESLRRVRAPKIQNPEAKNSNDSLFLKIAHSVPWQTDLLSW